MAKKETKKRLSRVHFIILGVALLAVATFLFSRNGETDLNFTQVERGDLVQELFETGSTEKGDDIRLSFKEGGRISSIIAKEGERVVRGEVMAVLDKRDLEISLREAEAALSSAEATLDRFLRGATTEEVNVTKAAVRSAETALSSAKSNLSSQERVAEETLTRAYQGIPTLLGDVFSKVKEVKIGVEDIANTYFTGIVVSETTSGRRSRDTIKRSSEEIEKHKDLAIRTDVDFSERETALRRTEDELRVIIRELDNLIVVADSDFYKDRFANTDKELLRTYRGITNIKLGEVIGLLGNISSVNADLNALISATERSVEAAETALNQAQQELLRVQANPDSADVRARRAAVDQARARVDLLRNRLDDATLRAPVGGIVSSVLGRAGEISSPGAPIFVIVPENDIQIAVDIYEGDIAKVSEGDEVRASFVAFPGEEFSGEVVFINPTGRVIDGVIYYSIKIALNEYPENVLPQMTVDVTIKTAEKSDVLLLPERAIYRKEGKNYVRILKNGEYEDREVVVGLRGEGRMAEIISGVQEGERIFFE